MKVKVKVGKPGSGHKAERKKLLRAISGKLKYKPEVIEAVLQHCTTNEICDGCPFVNVSGYCGQILNVEVLKYIGILKDLNSALAQHIEKLEGVSIDSID